MPVRYWTGKYLFLFFFWILAVTRIVAAVVQVVFWIAVFWIAAFNVSPKRFPIAFGHKLCRERCFLLSVLLLLSLDYSWIGRLTCPVDNCSETSP